MLRLLPSTGHFPRDIGWGKKWIGYGNKTSDTRSYLKGLLDGEIVISVEPFDVVFLCGLDDMADPPGENAILLAQIPLSRPSRLRPFPDGPLLA